MRAWQRVGVARCCGRGVQWEDEEGYAGYEEGADADGEAGEHFAGAFDAEGHGVGVDRGAVEVAWFGAGGGWFDQEAGCVHRCEGERLDHRRAERRHDGDAGYRGGAGQDHADPGDGSDQADHGASHGTWDAVAEADDRRQGQDQGRGRAGGEL